MARLMEKLHLKEAQPHEERPTKEQKKAMKQERKAQKHAAKYGGEG